MVLGGAAGPLHAFELTVSPARIEVRVEPGQVTEGVIQVRGRFDRPAKIRVTAGDWSLKPNGDFAFANPQADRSLAGWLRFTPAEFTLGDRPQAVRYRLQAPAGIVGGYWGVIYFESVLPKTSAEKGTVGVLTVGRLAATVYAETGRGAVRDGKITGVEARWSGGRLAMNALFTNLGNVQVRLTGRFEVQEPNTRKVVLRAAFDDLPVLPGGRREISSVWQGRLAPGSYVLLARVDYGGRNPAVGQFVLKIAK